MASREKDNGIDEVLAKVEEHREWLESSGRAIAAAPSGPRARSRRSRWPRCGDAWVTHGSAALGSLAEQVVAGDIDPFRAADELLAEL